MTRFRTLAPRLEAFTLIELLVVVAIIAILAGILFPVFAHAKDAANKTTFISNGRQVALSLVMYTQDNEDLFPRAEPFDEETQTITAGYPVALPANAMEGLGYPSRTMELGWPNVSAQYRKSNDVFKAPGRKIFHVSGIPNTAPDIGLAYNGVLQGYPSAAIASPSQYVMLWPGVGAINARGLAYSNPLLTCGDRPFCTFNDAAMVAYVYSDNGERPWRSLWSWGRGNVLIASDTSAKYRKFGEKTPPFSMPYEPWLDMIAARGLREPYANMGDNGEMLGSFLQSRGGFFRIPFWSPDLELP